VGDFKQGGRLTKFFRDRTVECQAALIDAMVAVTATAND
jgi:hypothetical protein